MLASITPLGERGRGATWALTVGAFLVGATVAGAVIGALLGALGRGILGGTGTHFRLAALAIALAAALALDLWPGLTPGPRRQVNERWLDEYRGWVYGLGFGAQLGAGVTTFVSTAATYAAFLAAFVSGSAWRGALVLGCFGAVRGLTPLAAARVKRPDQLMALHARLERWRGPAVRVQLVALAAVLAAATAGALS